MATLNSTPTSAQTQLTATATFNFTAIATGIYHTCALAASVSTPSGDPKRLGMMRWENDSSGQLPVAEKLLFRGPPQGASGL